MQFSGGIRRFALVLLAFVANASRVDAAATDLGRLDLISPLDYQVIQRTTRTNGTLVIAGAIARDTHLPDAMEFRLAGHSMSGDLPGKWQPLTLDTQGAKFRGEVSVPAGGWYRLEVRAMLKGKEISKVSIEHVGVGEIFVIAGQSNSANYGEEKQKTSTGLVTAFDGSAWCLAEDPEPGAGGRGGSFMPLFGDAMATRYHVPIGIVAMGIGSTSVREWLPTGTRIARLPTRTNNVVTNAVGEWEASGKIFERFASRLKQLGPHGFRAVLWHQGESDANQADPARTLPGNLYQDYLTQLVRASRKEAGWEIPWFVAQASYHSPTDTGSADIRAAQKALWDSGIALQGPDTDTLTGEMREKNGQGIHLSGKGLHEHARLWVEKVGPWLDRELE